MINNDTKTNINKGNKEEIKKEILDLLRSTNREGIENLIAFMEKSDYFTAPASTRFHGVYEGGLAEHSLNVYKILCHKVKNLSSEAEETLGEKLKIKEDTLILISVLHDLCKVNFYTVDYRNAKNELGVWEKVPYYKVEDDAPYGHGEKSVMMITEFLKLTAEEKYCIRWHMGFSEPKELYLTLGKAYKKYPLALLLHEADMESTYFFDI